MFPLLPNGARAQLRLVKEGESLRGAIVAVELGAQVVVHRVVRESSKTLVTRGITSPKEDVPTPLSAVVGVVYERSGLWLSEPALHRSAAALTFAVRGLRALARR